MTARLHFPDLVTAAEAYSEDPDLFVAVFLVGPPTARNTERNRWYVSGIRLDDDCESIEAVFAPERGGHVYSVSDLLNDGELRGRIRQAAAVRRSISAMMATRHD